MTKPPTIDIRPRPPPPHAPNPSPPASVDSGGFLDAHGLQLAVALVALLAIVAIVVVVLVLRKRGKLPHLPSLAALRSRAPALLALAALGLLVVHEVLAGSTRGRFLTILLVAAVAGAVAYVRRAKRAERDVGKAITGASLLFAYPYLIILSWAYRIETMQTFGALSSVVVLYARAFAIVPFAVKVKFVMLLAGILLEIYWIELYYVGHRKIHRHFHPDLVLVTPGSGNRRLKGRVYNKRDLEAADASGTYRIQFAPKTGLWASLLQWYRRDYMTLRTSTKPTIDKREVSLTAADMQYNEKTKEWTLTNDAFVTTAVSGDGTTHLLKRLSGTNAEIVRSGMEGNPWVLAPKTEGSGPSTFLGDFRQLDPPPKKPSAGGGKL